MTQIEVKLNPDTPPTGSDLAVVNAARRSFNSRSEWDTEPRTKTIRDGKAYFSDFPPPNTLKEKDKRLIEFLARGMTADNFGDLIYELGGEGDHGRFTDLLWQWRNTPTHDTPFNHTFISFEVKVPVFVARQLVKHEYLIWSEISRRYITDDIEFYEPDYWRKAAPDKKQGSLEEPIDPRWPGGDQPWLYYNGKRYENIALKIFNNLIENGTAPEQARMVLPQSMMVEVTWSGTLSAFAKMCRERLSPDAQYESRIVAQKVYEYLKEYYPVSAPALVEGPR